MKRKNKKRASRRKPRKARNTTTAIVAAPKVEIVRSSGRRHTLSTEEIDLLKKTVAKGTDDQEFLLFMTICRKHRLDPFTKQIYCVIWPTDNGKSHELVIITGINGYRTMAARSHRDFAGTSSATFKFFSDKRETPAGRLIPEVATIKALRKGAESAEVTVYWEEFAPKDLSAKRSDFWNRMPKHMLAKVAESQALRKAYPDLSDIYTEEEMSQRLEDLTEGGRQISLDGTAPSGKILEGGYQQAHMNAKAVAEAKIRGDWCEKHNCVNTSCPSDEHTHQENEEVFQRAQEKKTINGPPAAAKPAPAPPQPPADSMVGIDWTDKDSPIVRGNLTDILDILKENCTMTWGPDGWWHVLPVDVPVIKKICKELGMVGHEYFPKSSGKPEAKPETKTKSASAAPASERKHAGPTLVTGTIHRVIAGMTKHQSPTLNVKINSEWHMSFVNPIFEYISKGIGQLAEIWIDEKKFIVGLKRIGRKEFDEDGRTPIIQRNQQEPQKSLYP